MTKVWVITGHSESGDDFGPEVFSEKPPEKLQKALAHSWDGDDAFEGPGSFGSFVYLTVTEAKVDSFDPNA